MNGNDDFFGGSVVPPPSAGNGPVAGPPNPLLTGTKEYGAYGSFSSASAPPKNASPVLPLVIGALVLAVAAGIGLVAYRSLFGGTQIEIPQTLMGMERMDEDAPLAQQVEQLMADSAGELGDVDAEIGVFQSGEQLLFVMAGEAGLGDTEDADAYFAGFEDGFNQSGSQGTLVEVDPGPGGGEMRCIALPTGGTCAWIADDTFGAFAMSPIDGDPAATAVQIRATIEQ